MCGGKSESPAGPRPSSPPLLLSQTGQLAALQAQDAAGAEAGLMVRVPETPFRASPALPRPKLCSLSLPPRSPCSRG